MSKSNGTTKHEPNVGVVKRHCPQCHEWTRVTITETADGREIWWCHRCDARTEYRVR